MKSKWSTLNSLRRVSPDWEFTELKMFSNGNKNSFVNGPFGSDLLSSELVPEGAPVVYIRDIKDGRYQRKSKVCVTEEKYRALSACQVSYGDLLVSKVGDPPCEAAVYDSKQPGVVTQDIIRIKTKGIIFSSFLSYLLNSDIGKRQVKRIKIAGTRERVSLTDFKNLILPRPMWDEQEKIAKILSTWDQAITATKRLLENSQQRKKGLMQQLLTGKKRLPGFEGEWKTVELGSLGSTYPGLSGKTKEDFGDGEPFVTYMDVFSDGVLRTDRFDRVRLKEGESQNKVQYGDILFTTSSETPEEVGMASVLLERLSYNLYLNSFCFGFRPYSFEDLVPEYARFLFRGEEMRRRISALAQGATRYNLSKKQLVKLEVLLPGKAEQTAISQALATSDMEISAVKHRLTYLREEKKALMQQLLTGKRRVKVDAEAA